MKSRVTALLAVVIVFLGVGWLMRSGPGVLSQGEACTAEVGGLSVTISHEQAKNASLIAAIGMQRGLPARAVSIALATAYQESKIVNLNHGDRDSLGLFQQRPSQGWGSGDQVRDPVYATNKFYDALVNIDNYETMRITEAAQAVQRSGFPEAYDDHAADGRALASALTGNSTGGAFWCSVEGFEGQTAISRTLERLQTAYGSTLSVTRVADQRRITIDGSNPQIGWSAAAFLLAHAQDHQIKRIEYRGKVWQSGDSAQGWQVNEKPANKTVVVDFA